jgi:AraC-like DNA-binding protein
MGANDHPSGLSDGASETVAAPAVEHAHPASDPLADVLGSIRLTGALFFLVEATTPWCVDIPAAPAFAHLILPQAQHVVSYHVVVAGSGYARVPGVAPLAIAAGDVIVFPHADPYIIQDAPDTPPELDAEQTMAFFRALAAGELPFVVTEGGGGDEHARFICGFLGCDVRPFNPLLAALPRLLRVSPASGAEPDALDRLVELTLAESRSRRPGGASVRLRLAELMFVEVIRRFVTTLPAAGSGWLAGLQDPVVSRALMRLHADPQAPWTLAGLARETGASRSSLSDRFAALLGIPPMQYLANWRMQLAARLLDDGNLSVAEVAEAVGYGSDAGFSRTFKRLAGVSPAAWRRRAQVRRISAAR